MSIQSQHVPSEVAVGRMGIAIGVLATLPSVEHRAASADARDISAVLKGALAPVVDEHFAAITEPRRIGELMHAIHGYVGQPSAVYALKLAPLLFVRSGEL